jgi:UDP-2,4-diacetamido-2,4,6-trideoxy-beta-L-altropyranose hydrolase
MTKKVIIRTDSSFQMGLGHVFRCLTLANQLVKYSCEVTFICREFEGNKAAHVIEQGHNVIYLKDDPNFKSDDLYETWLGASETDDAQEVIEALIANDIKPDMFIVDHYGISNKWHKIVNKKKLPLLVIDDLANREYECSHLLDQTFKRPVEDYSSQTPDGSVLMLGSKFALLRSEFAELSKKSISRRENLGNKVLVNLGGSDPKNVAGNILRILTKGLSHKEIQIIVIGIDKSLAKEALENNKTTELEIEFIHHTNKMADIMLDVDLCIGAPGATSWERCCLGLPTLLVQTADNQKLIAKNLSDSGATHFLGKWNELNDEHVIASVRKFLNKDTLCYKKMVKNCYKVCDGAGVDRVAKSFVTIGDMND